MGHNVLIDGTSHALSGGGGVSSTERIIRYLPEIY